MLSFRGNLSMFLLNHYMGWESSLHLQSKKNKICCPLFSINDHPRSIGLQLRVYEQGNKVDKNFTAF